MSNRAFLKNSPAAGAFFALVVLVTGCTRTNNIVKGNNQQPPVPGNSVSEVPAALGTIRHAPVLASQKSGVVEIKEKMFISQVNDVYLNPDDYLGKTIKLEGIFKQEEYYDGSAAPYFFVIRYGPGCCGTDGNAGFEVKWEPPDQSSEGETLTDENPYPPIDSWVEATGELKIDDTDEEVQYLYLDLASLVVLEERGTETVLQ